MEKEQVELLLKRAEISYWKEVNRICEKIREENVIPFCHKHKLKFGSGMGTWNFATLSKNRIIDIERYPSKSFQKMYEILSTINEFNNFEIGTTIEEYNPRFVRENTNTDEYKHYNWDEILKKEI